MIFRRGQEVVEPGFGQMDGEFVHRIARVNHFTGQFYVEAGLLTNWRRMSGYRWNRERERWVQNNLPIDVEP